MKPIICIPSYDRPNARIFEKLKQLPLDVFVFVRKEQYKTYKSVLPEQLHLVKLKHVSDIGETRKVIVNWASSKGYDWIFMFDDDISKVEKLIQAPDGKFNSKRILDKENSLPRFELDSLQRWFKIAKKYDLSLSSPVYRFNTRGDGGYILYLNKRPCIQCILIKTQDILDVGNYESTRIIGAEDYALQYKLMKQGFNTGVLASIEYDCPAVGSGKGGNNSVESLDLLERYTEYVKLFYEKVNPDKDLIFTKYTKTGIPSIKFNWKNWNGKKIDLEVK